MKILVLLGALAVWGVCACEMVLTSSEIRANRARAVEIIGQSSVEFGYTTIGVGDLNDDGFDDFAISSPTEDYGVVYIVFGRSAAEWANASFSFSGLTTDSSSWIRIGASVTSELSRDGIAHGDFNGDGISDLALSSSLSKAYIVFGHRGEWSSFTSNDIESNTVLGFTITCEGTFGPKIVGNAGDLNGDGVEDVFVADSTNKVSVVFGINSASRADFDLNMIDGSNGFALKDDTLVGLGKTNVMGSAGDINGDGLADLAIGSQEANSKGSVYIIFARNVSASGKPWPKDLNLLADLNGTDGAIISGPDSDENFGHTVVGAGDVNGDGFADIFIGSSSNSATAGVWVVFGHPAPWVSPLNASELNGVNGFYFSSENSENWGRSGGGVGDVNGDGIADFVIGAYSAQDSTGIGTGAAALIFGHNGTWPAVLNRNNVVWPVGFLIDGIVVSGYFGRSAHGAGDVNGDGLADFVVGAHANGYVVLVFGFNDHCTVCNATTESCLVCDDGFILNNATCEANQTVASSSSDIAVHSSSFSATTTSVSGTVVVIETGGGGSAGEVAAEVAQLLGVDVGQISVVEITPGTFEVTVINEEVAQQLVTLIEQCIEEASGDQQL